MKIAILGSGNVAYHLAKMFKEKNIPISQIFGRNEKDLQEISEQFEIPFSTTELVDAELYFIAVNDDAVAAISKNIKNQNSLVAHTSGSLPKEILEGNYRKASFYPLQTFSKSKMLQYSEIPFFVEAENEADSQILENLALKISEKVMKSDYEKRKYIHLTAVFACNFVNHLFGNIKEISDSSVIKPRLGRSKSKVMKITIQIRKQKPVINLVFIFFSKPEL